MRSSHVAVAVTAVLATGALVACSGSSGSSTQSKKPGKSVAASDLVKDGTFSFSVNDDPGSLNPISGSRTVGVNLFRFLYDPLVHKDSKGKIVSGLAESWQVNGNVLTFKLKSGVTCSDGSPVTATTVAQAFANLKDPKQGGSLIGIALPNGDYTTKADDASSTFTLTLAKPYLFILPALEFLPIPCGAAGKTPVKLETTASGSGPYTLKEAVSGDHYTLVRRDGYAWGPGGATTAEAGLPKTIVMKVIASESTAANLLSTGQLNAAAINGPDRQRLTAQGMTATPYVSGGNMFLFNEGSGRITADPAVRKAIVEALDLDEVAKVVTQGLNDKASHSLAPAEPQACPDTAAADSVPKTDVEDAKKLLDGAGWTAGSGGTRAKGGKQLVLKAPYLSTYAGNQPALELISQKLSAIGVKLTLSPITQATLSTTIFSTGDYDIWPVLALSVPFQSGLFGLLGGPTPPNGINAGHVANTTFAETAARANTMSGQAGCDEWVKAEQALFSNADAVPVAPVMTNWVTTKSAFQTMQGRIIPTSIRVTK
jgi:peptide/nickel transport system substrate-binding protein